MKLGGFILIVFGFVLLIVEGIEYNKEEKILDTPVLRITKKEHNTVTWPLYAGIATILAGTLIVLSQTKKR